MPAGKQKLQYEVGLGPARALWCFLALFDKEKWWSRGSGFCGCAARSGTEPPTDTAGRALGGSVRTSTLSLLQMGPHRGDTGAARLLWKGGERW